MNSVNDDDDDDDDDDNGKFFGEMVDWRKTFPDEIIVRDSHLGKSLTYLEKYLSLCKTWVQTWLNEVVQ